MNKSLDGIDTSKVVSQVGKTDQGFSGFKWTLPKEAVDAYDTDSSEFLAPNARISSISPATSYYSNPYEIERSSIQRDTRDVYHS